MTSEQPPIQSFHTRAGGARGGPYLRRQQGEEVEGRADLWQAIQGEESRILFIRTWTRALSTATGETAAATTTIRSTARGAPMAGLLKELYNQRSAPFPTRSGANAGARREGARGSKLRRQGQRWRGEEGEDNTTLAQYYKERFRSRRRIKFPSPAAAS
jgi:hypothetical protein